MVKALSLSERAAIYKKLLNAFLASGPDIQDTLMDLQIVQGAIQRIITRHARFGDAQETMLMSDEDWKGITVDGEVKSLETQVVALVSGTAGKLPAGLPDNSVVAASDAGRMTGASNTVSALKAPGDWIALFRSLFEMVISQPVIRDALLALFLNLLKPKTL